MSEPTIRDVLDALIDFREAVELRFDSNDQRFNSNNQRFDRIDEHLAAHDRRFDDIDRRLDSHDRRFASLEASMDEGFKTVNHRLGKLEAQRH